MSKNKSKKAASKSSKASKKPVAKVAKKAKPVKVLAKAKAVVKPAKLLKSKANPVPQKEQPKASKGKSGPKTGIPGLKDQQAIVAGGEEVAEEVVLTNAEGKRYCRVADCDEAAMIDGHCRLHYIMYWKRNKNKAKILEGGKLDKYIEELTQRYPDKYLEILKKDLLSEKEFTGIITEMDAEDAADDENENEDDSRFVEEIRGGIPTGSDDDEF